MSSIARTYIQQLKYDGSTYTKGAVVDIMDVYQMGVTVFPFVKYSSVKDPAKRDWHDEHGVDVYYGGIYQKDYDMTVEVVCYGSLSTLRQRIDSFLRFLCGYDTTGMSCLAVYDEHVGIGRKNVRYNGNENTLWYNEDVDDEKIATFNIYFHVDDPMTDVLPSLDGSGSVTDLTWQS